MSVRSASFEDNDNDDGDKNDDDDDDNAAPESLSLTLDQLICRMSRAMRSGHLLGLSTNRIHQILVDQEYKP